MDRKEVVKAGHWGVMLASVNELTSRVRPSLPVPNLGASVIDMEAVRAADDSVLLNEQAALLRECRLALEELLKKKPMLAGLICGSTTLGNLRASLYAYRPQGGFEGRRDGETANG